MGLLLGFVLLLVSLATLGAAVIARGAGRPLRRLLLAQAVLFLVGSAYLAFYVASEDDYRDSGISRWEAYDAQGLTLTALAAGVLVGLLALLALRSSRVAVLVGPAGVAAALLVAAAFLANSLN